MACMVIHCHVVCEGGGASVRGPREQLRTAENRREASDELLVALLDGN